MHEPQQDPGRHPHASRLRSSSSARTRKAAREALRSLREGRAPRTSRCSGSTARIRFSNNPVRPRRESATKSRHNAARAFQAARLVAKAITARKSLLAYDEKLKLNSPARQEGDVRDRRLTTRPSPSTELAGRLVRALREGGPQGGPTPTRLSRTPSSLRLGLGQEDLAIADAQTFTEELRRRRSPHRRPRSRSPVGAHYAEQGNWTRARGALTGSMGVIDKAAPDVQAQAHATLGRVYLNYKGTGETQAKGRVRPRSAASGTIRRRPRPPSARRTRRKTPARRIVVSRRRSTPSVRRTSSPPRSVARPRSRS